MQTNIYSNAPYTTYTYTKPRFFKRQFDMNMTKGKRGFDITFGLIMPILCFIFDPIFFKGWFIEYGLFGDFQLFAYGVAAIEIITFVLWMFPRQHPQGIGKVYGSIMLAGGVFSFMLGVILLPFTLIGVLFVIGFLGFVPFLTAFVFWRNGICAMKHGGWNIHYSNLIVAIASGIVFAIAAPLFFQWRVWQSTNEWIEQIKENRLGSNLALKQMKAISLITDYTERELKEASHSYSSDVERERLLNAYREVTGKEEIEEYRDF